MEYLDGWASTVGTATCGFLIRHGHNAVYRGLCSDGYAPAGWKLFIFALVFATVSYFMWRFMRPH